MGVDSGLPDFRGNEGFWKAYPPMAKLGISFIEMANPTWFDDDPTLAWGFYGHRLNLYRRTAPHRGFTQLLEIGRQKRGGYFVFTSNVDGQFQKAGFAEEQVEECHGSIHHLQCTHPCSAGIWDARDERVAVDEDTFRAKEPLPRCKHCSGMARPNVLMFGDWSWISTRTDSQSGRRSAWLKGILEARHRLAIVEVGAGRNLRQPAKVMADIARQCQEIMTLHALLVSPDPKVHPMPDCRAPDGGGSILRDGKVFLKTLARFQFLHRKRIQPNARPHEKRLVVTDSHIDLMDWRIRQQAGVFD